MSRSRLAPSRTLDLPTPLTCISLRLLRPQPLTYPQSSRVPHLHSRCASRLRVPAAPSAKGRVFSVPVTSSTLLALQYFSFPVKHKDDFKKQLGSKNLTCVLHRYFVSILPALAARSSRQSTLCCLPDSTILLLQPIARKKELASKYIAKHKLTIQPTSYHLSPLSSSSFALHDRVTKLEQNTLQFKIWITFKTSHRTSLLHFKHFVTHQLLTLPSALNSCSHCSSSCCCSSSCYFCSSCSYSYSCYATSPPLHKI